MQDGNKRRDLTIREKEIGEFIAAGLTNSEISAKLRVSQSTVKKHVSNMLLKLGFTRRTQMAAHVIRQGLLDDSASDENT